MHWPADEFPEKWNYFKHAFITISNECALMETRRLKSRSNPWIDSHSLQMTHKRDYLKIKAIAFQDGKLWNFYRLTRNGVTKLVRDAKGGTTKSVFNTASTTRLKCGKSSNI